MYLIWYFLIHLITVDPDKINKGVPDQWSGYTVLQSISNHTDYKEKWGQSDHTSKSDWNYESEIYLTHPGLYYKYIVLIIGNIKCDTVKMYTF